MLAATDCFFTRLHSFLERSRWWLLWVGIICLFWSVFCASGMDFTGRWRFYERGYAEKLEDPFCNLVGVYPPGSHTEKLNYRVTVPLALHLMGFRDWRAYIPLTLATIFLLPVLTALVVERHGLGRHAALLAALLVASLSLASYQLPWLFDAAALCLLTAACIPTLPLAATCALIVAAGFTDERAIVAAFAVFFARLDLEKLKLTSPLTWSGGAAVATGVMVTLLLRWAIHATTGLPFSHKGVGLYFFHDNASILWGAMWYVLEGGWLVAISAGALLWQRRSFTALLLITAGAGGVTLFSMTIADLSRTLAFLLPFFFVAVRIVGASDRTLLLRRLRLGWLISFLCGTCFFHETVEWFQPLPFQIGDRATGALLDWWQHSRFDRE